MAFESLSDKLTEAFKRLRGKGRLTEADVKQVTISMNSTISTA